jgi:hypothetical protein
MGTLIFSSGMSRRGDFVPALRANHSIGIDIGEMSPNAMRELAAEMANSSASVFVDSGAFGHFRAGLRGDVRKPLDFARIFEKYDALGQAVGQADPDGYANDRLFFVVPDVIGDQAATLAVLQQFRDSSIGYARFANAIVPIHGGAMSLTEMYDEAAAILGRSMLHVGIPSKAEAVAGPEFEQFMRERGDDVWSVHILGAASSKTLAPRLASLELAGYDGPITADANRLRSLWNPRKGVTRPQALLRLIGAAPEQLAMPLAA